MLEEFLVVRRHFFAIANRHMIMKFKLFYKYIYILANQSALTRRLTHTQLTYTCTDYTIFTVAVQSLMKVDF